MEHHGLGRLVICATGICLCYLFYGILQERLLSGRKHLGATFILVLQCITNSAVAHLWHHLDEVKKKTMSSSDELTNGHGKPNETAAKPLPYLILLITSACYVTAMTCSNEAIQYVSYPVAVLAKSCKLIPIMLVGQLVEGRLYSTQEWLAALSISAGIVLFHVSRMKHATMDSDDQTTYGMFLLLISLTMDGLLSSSQNFLKRPSDQHRAPNATETMYYVNLFALLFLIPLSILLGQWQEGINMLFDGNLALSILILNATVAIGQIFIFLTITWYSPVVTTTITTTRKFFTILISVVAFGHSFSTAQWTAVALVFSGLYLAIMVQRSKSPKVKDD